MVNAMAMTTALSDAAELRNQGLTDDIIIDELTKRGYSMEDIQVTLSQLDEPSAQSSSPMTRSYSPAGQEDVYSRMEEIAESIIDEKWDQLIGEVRKIIDWKERVEEAQRKLMNDIEKLKDDFSTLHQGVLGKLDEYDFRMTDVGTELKAVGKVFKDVVPEFVENVKELSAVTAKMKGHK